MKLNLLVPFFSFFFLFYQPFTVEAKKTGINLRRENLQGEGSSLQRIAPLLGDILSRSTLLPQKTLSSVQPVNKKEERFYSDAFSKLFEDGQRLFTILGVVLGGVWTYYNYFNGRTFRDRLELKVTGRIIPKENFQYVVVECSIKNIGLSKTDIKKEGTALKISSPILNSIPLHIELNKLNQVYWEHLYSNEIFLNQWLEPNEILYEQYLYTISKENNFPLKAELQIATKNNNWDGISIIGFEPKSYTSKIENEQEINP